MSLSSGGWTPGPGHTGEHSSVVPSHHGAPQQAQPGCQTVLMSVRVSVCHSTIRPLSLPGVGDEPLQLQLSMDPRKSGEFRLSLQDCSSGGRATTIAEFDLGTVSYEVKTPMCHELRLAVPPHDGITFNFRCEQEAWEWATVLTSSLREAQKATPQSSVAQCPSDSLNMQNTVTLKRTEETCIELAQAIESGDMQSASVIAAALSRQLVKLKIQPSATNYEDTEISLTVVVEDSASSCSVTVKVFPRMTTAALKQQMFLDYGFHPRVQRWVIGQCLCTDQRSLASYGVHRDGDTAFLYLLAARHARLSPQVFQQDQESALLLPPPPLTPQTFPTHAATANAPSSLEQRPYATLPPRLHTSSINGYLSGGSDRGISTEIKALINLEMPELNQALSPKTTPVQGWSCPSCTFINKPTRPGCEICSANRPESYVVPGGHRPDTVELHRIQQEKETVRQYQQEKGRREVLRSAVAQHNSLLFNLDQDY